MPTPDAAGEHHHDDSQVDKLVQQANIGDVADPDLIWTNNDQVPDQIGIGIALKRVLAPGGSGWGVLPFAGLQQVQLANQAAYSFAIDTRSLAMELFGDAVIIVSRPLASQLLDGRFDGCFVLSHPWIVIAAAS